MWKQRADEGMNGSASIGNGRAAGRGRAVRSLVVVAAVSAGLGGLTLGATKAIGSGEDREARSPGAIVVKYHADWCIVCKGLEGPFREAEEALGEDAALFVTLDFSNEATSHRAELLSSQLGLGALWPEYGGRTAVILVIDPDDGSVVGRFAGEATASEIEKSARKAMG